MYRRQLAPSEDLDGGRYSIQALPKPFILDVCYDARGGRSLVVGYGGGSGGKAKNYSSWYELGRCLLRWTSNESTFIRKAHESRNDSALPRRFSLPVDRPLSGAGGSAHREATDQGGT